MAIYTTTPVSLRWPLASVDMPWKVVATTSYTDVSANRTQSIQPSLLVARKWLLDFIYPCAPTFLVKNHHCWESPGIIAQQMPSVKRNACNCLKSYVFKSIRPSLSQCLVRPAINVYQGSNPAVAIEAFQATSLFTFTAAFLWHYLPECRHYYKESWWLNKCNALSIRNILWMFTVCQLPGDAEITKTNTAFKTESFHT